MARSSLLLCLLAVSSYAFAVKQPSTFAARSTALKMTGGSMPPPPTTPMPTLKVRDFMLPNHILNFLVQAERMFG